jgi:hypothetical protein
MLLQAYSFILLQGLIYLFAHHGPYDTAAGIAFPEWLQHQGKSLRLCVFTLCSPSVALRRRTGVENSGHGRRQTMKDQQKPMKETKK